MRLLKTAVPIAALLAAIFVLYTTYFSSSGNNVNPVVNAVSSALDIEKEKSVQSNEKPTNTAAPQSVPSDGVDSLAPVEPELTEPSLESANEQTDYPPLAGYEVGLVDISEEEYLELVERLRNDPVLLAELLDELRAETDPARLKRLTIMLGATGSADVLPAAEELVYSSDSVARKTGLDLLSRVAPQNPEAYDIANTILGSEADPQVLVSTMNVLALPKNAGPDAKATAISQIKPLADHDSAAVRRHSVSLLVRLTNDETLSPILFDALSDPDASVRSAATYAYASYPYQTSEAVERLMQIIEDPSENRGVRQGAMLAISKMSPDENTEARLKAAKQQMRESQQ